MRKRNRHISVWMNEQEYRHLKRQAELAGMGIDPFIRNLVAGIELRPKPPEEYAALLRELSAIGNNINQLAYWANARGSVRDEEITQALVFGKGKHTTKDGLRRLLIDKSCRFL